MNAGLDQYKAIFKDEVEDSATKLTKSFEKIRANGFNSVAKTTTLYFSPNLSAYLISFLIYICVRL